MRHAFGSAAATPAAVLGFDVGPLDLGPTPVAILVSVIGIGAVLTLLVVLTSQVAGAFVDKRWPANEPLTPSEVLWGESGGHVAKTFPGLDPVIARDLTQYITTTKVTPGSVIIEEGDLPTKFVLVKSGAVEQVGAGGAKASGPGSSFGADNIIRRMPFDFTLRATAPTEVVSLGAEDYLAAVALGMSDDDDDYVVHVLGGYLSGEAVPAPSPSMPPSAPAPAPAAEPVTRSFAPPSAPRPPSWPAATHRVSGVDLPAYVLPAGDAPTRTLPVGSEVQETESLPGWSHVRTADGWTGWVTSSGLTRL